MYSPMLRWLRRTRRLPSRETRRRNPTRVKLFSDACFSKSASTWHEAPITFGQMFDPSIFKSPARLHLAQTLGKYQKSQECSVGRGTRAAPGVHGPYKRVAGRRALFSSNDPSSPARARSRRDGRGCVPFLWRHIHSRDHDGTLTGRELRGRLSAREFAAADADRDGTISKDEYLAVVEQRFKAADADNDGTLTRPELRTKAGRQLLRRPC